MMELMRTMLLALAPTHTTRFNRGGAAGSSPRPTALVAIAARDSPPRAGSPSSLRILPPPPSSGSQQALLTVVGGAAASSSVVQFAPDGSAVAAAAEAELERLRDRVVQLERQLAQKMKLDWLVRPMGVGAAGGAGPSGGGPLLGGDGLLGSLPELAVDVAAIVGAFTRLEAEEREGIAEQEATAHAAIDSAHRLVLAEAKAVAQRRFLIQTPYEAYRPRIPIQHSLRGEEYLRRWLMAETFKHYEDVLGQLQRWENDVRCGIEEEAFALFPLMRAQVFEPLHVARCEVLEEELDDLRHLKIRHERAATVLATAEKLRLVCDTEARARKEIAYYARIDRQRIGEVASSLAVLKDVQRTADGLRAELGRATARHREEMVGLHQHLTALDEEGAARRLREGEEKFNAYLESAFVRGGGGVPLYESLASMRPPPTAAAIPIVPQPPSTAAAGPSPPTGSSRAPSLGGPRSGRRASHSTAALGAAVAVSSSSAAAASSAAGSSEAVGSARARGAAAKSQLTPRRVANGNGGHANSDAKLTHAQQTKDIYSRPVQRRHSSSQQQQQQQQRSSSKQKEGASSTGYWAGF